MTANDRTKVQAKTALTLGLRDQALTIFVATRDHIKWYWVKLHHGSLG